MNQTEAPKNSKPRFILRELNFRLAMILMDYMIKYSRDFVKMNKEARENISLKQENASLRAKIKELEAKKS